MINGTIEIRDIAQPETLDAKIVERHIDDRTNTTAATLVVEGRLRRSAFGMTADESYISDSVDLLIRIRLLLDVDARWR
jgi:polyisoprenoid-binding protein YceI